MRADYIVAIVGMGVLGCTTSGGVAGHEALSITSPHGDRGSSVPAERADGIDARSYGLFAVAPEACSIRGAPRVVAAKAAPPGGVAAVAGAGQIRLRFARNAETRIVMALNPSSLEVVAADESPPSELEEARFMALTAWPEALSVERASGHALKSRATMTGRSWAVTLEPAYEPVPTIARIDTNRSILAWTEGSANSQKDVRVRTIAKNGESLGAPVTLPHEGSAIGQPAVAVTPSGWGVVAFLDSNGHGFELVAASLDCTSPTTPEITPMSASRIAP